MTKNPPITAQVCQHLTNGDRELEVALPDGDTVVGIGSFHKSLRHNRYGEVEASDFDELKAALVANDFSSVPPSTSTGVAPLTNPMAGTALDRLISPPSRYEMPAAPTVLSDTTAAEMVELYWMALLRDLPFNEFESNPDVLAAVTDINGAFARAVDPAGLDGGRLLVGIDVPGPAGQFTPRNLFRLGLPGEEVGPMVSQFFVRPVPFGTQTIDARQLPYRSGQDYLTDFPSWLAAQNSGRDHYNQAYGQSNEDSVAFYDPEVRYISTMRDLARFVNKDALHQAYFNAALLLLSGGAEWTPGNPYKAMGRRDAGFGVLGGPHILALVSEVATRALKAVWFQKWQTHLRLRPEAYGGLAHVQNLGVVLPGEAAPKKRAYGLPAWLFDTEAINRMQARPQGGHLLPMAFSAGSPTHPAYGAGHATVAGACVTVLKAFFQMLEPDPAGGAPRPIPLSRLLESDLPYGTKPPMKAYVTGLREGVGQRMELGRFATSQLTIEGELNKLAHNVAMGRSMGGVHWRTDNARSLVLGEALAARILCDIAGDVAEKPTFTFRTFARDAGGQPRTVVISDGRVLVNGVQVHGDFSQL